MFAPLPSQFSFPEAEERILRFWEEHDVFGRSLAQRHDAPRFVFYEGPPTANGLPHPGHCLTRAIKDLFPRYQTMCGRLVERKAGWDTHGLPVEVEVCKDLGIHTKEEIEQYGVEKFVRKCIDSVFRYVKEWEQMTRRLGFWVNLEDAYVTFHQSYVESVWWGLKTLFERGLLYQGHKVVWWWAQGGTALSAGEVGEGYRTVQDPSVNVKFPLVAEGTKGSRGQGAEGGAARRLPHLDPGPLGPSDPARVSLLVWTTTPWTLVSNHFAAVGPDIDYALIHDKTTGEYLYIASALVQDVADKFKHDFEAVGVCKGSDLVGLRYMPPFDSYYRKVPPKEWSAARAPSPDDPPGVRVYPVPPMRPFADVTAPLKSRNEEDHVAWRVIDADFVDIATGTGIVHIAPAFGEVDFDRLQQERQRFASFDAVPLINAVKPDGTFSDEAPAAYRGRWVKDCDKDIIRELKERGVLLHQETIEHEYPFCPRAEDDALIQYARKSWFVRTSQFKDEFLANNAGITWLPEHIKEGRFGDFLRNNVDWALSRERYWGTPLPIWVCERCGKMEALGSLAELKGKPDATDGGLWAEKKAADPTLPDHLSVHKPYIDAWTYQAPCCHGARMRRVPEVIDCWWDAGSMPFAQWGFPHAENSLSTFADRFPADFISEALDQTRGWFYGMLAISTLLFSSDTDSSKRGTTEEGGTGVPPVGAGLGGTGVPPVGRTGTSARLTTRQRNLPHWEAGGNTYFVTFRAIAGELSPQERDLVLQSCRHWDEERLLLHAVAVMPDHVHLLLTPLEKSPGTWWSLSELMHSIKGYTGHEIAKRRGTPGSMWQDESYDRIIRNASDYEEKLRYVLDNAERAALGEKYPWLWLEPTHAEHRRDACATRPSGTPHSSALASSTPASTATPSLPRRSYPHPYRACIVLGLMLGEDGLKMSKRKKNYREPSYVFDHYGADAMRWFLFSGQTPWTSVRFEEQNIRDTQREFLVRLYNVFSFFVIYANIDGFAPGRGPGAEGPRGPGAEGPRGQGAGGGPVPTSPRSHVPTPTATAWRPPAERSELDRWIISELHRTTAFVREKLDGFENYPAAGRLNEFVDALSNWYVRRSRDRFWRPLAGDMTGCKPVPQEVAGGETGCKPVPQDQDKWDAYNTLYEVLVALSKLIAPFTPFFAEVMYQNLVTGQGVEGPRDQGEDVAPRAPLAPRTLGSSAPSLSVHLCDYPVADAALIDENLAQEMDLVRDIVSLGRAARTTAKLKVRQPLALAEIILARREHTGWLEAHSDLIAEELNIKQVGFATEAEQYVTCQLKADFKAIGPKFGKLAPQIAAALGKLDPADARATLSAGGTLALNVGGTPVQLTSQEVQVRLEAKPGWSAAQGRAGVVVVKTELTPELIDEGLTRELIHHVQSLRKELQLAYEQRITLYLEAPAELQAVITRFADIIKRECLAEELAFSPPPADAAREFKVEAYSVRLAVVPR